MTIFRKITPSILVLLISELLLILLFPWSLVFESTLAAGGDTPSHYMAAVAMSRGLLTFLSPVKWVYGAYAGYPLFLHYFPLPFALAGLISKAVSLKIAFKLVTLLAIIPLPGAVFLCLRLLGYRQNIPAIGAVLSLPFLLMTENTIWGGNIGSTLSGEFAFAISFILYIIFTGKLYADVTGGKSFLGSSVLESLIALSHGYPILQSVAGSVFFILRGRNLKFIMKLHAAAAGFAAFWLLPLLWRIHWNTPYSYCWHFEKWTEIAPPVLWPAFAGSLILACSCLGKLFGPRKQSSPVLKESIESPELYLTWQLGVALLGFSLAPFMGLVDIRFLPFAQIMLVLLGAIGWGRLLSRLPLPNLWQALFCAAIMALALSKVTGVDKWIQWNYSGMESKPLWHSYRLVNEYLNGDENSPRVVCEHDGGITGETGSSRAFELLPYYSGRSPLEGLYMQSGLNAPFVFYIQSELSQFASNPLPEYCYSRPDPERAAAHLRLFNVSQVIAASDNIVDALDSSPDYEPDMSIPPYRIFRLRGCGDSYVDPLEFRPLRMSPGGWKERQFEWFRKSSLRVPLVVASEDSPGDYWKGLEIYQGDPGHIPEVPIQREQIQAHASLGEGKITIDTSKPGHPLWIKVSYHPDWRVSEGAGELYLASPAFMLLVPKTSRVVLTFDTGAGIYLYGKILFILTVLAFVLRAFLQKVFGGLHQAGAATPTLVRFFLSLQGKSSGRHKPLAEGIGTNRAFFIIIALMVLTIVGAISTRNHRDPVLLYYLAVDEFDRVSEKESSPAGPASLNWPSLPVTPETLGIYELLNEGIARFGHSSVVDFAVMYKAIFMFSWKRWDDLRPLLEGFLRDNPGTRIYTKSMTLLGDMALESGKEAEAESYYKLALSSWPGDEATNRAGLRLAYMIGVNALLETANEFFSSGRYIEAYNIYQALSLSEDKKIADQSVISLAYCSFHMNRWQEAADLFLKWLGDNFEAPGSAAAQADYKLSLTIIDQNRQWMPELERQEASPPRSGWIVRLQKKLMGK
jgi:tetratricopeptide (TPR) repeat protein